MSAASPDSRKIKVALAGAGGTLEGGLFPDSKKNTITLV